MSDEVNFAHQTVAIVGLGLMGASLAAALQGRCRHVVGVARRTQTIDHAQQLGWIDQGTTSLSEGVGAADIVVLATPVRTVIALLGQIGPWLREQTLVMDLGSTKREVVAAMELLPPRAQPLGGHPMCGKEQSGLEAADPNLYIDRVFVLTPLARTSALALHLGQELARAVGARPYVLDAERHDRAVATVSHLPYLAALGLMGALHQVAAEDPAARTLAASGFRDASRLAASDVEMMLDILLTNSQPILERLHLYQQQLARIDRALQARDEAFLRQAMAEAREQRKEMYR